MFLFIFGLSFRNELLRVINLVLFLLCKTSASDAYHTQNSLKDDKKISSSDFFSQPSPHPSLETSFSVGLCLNVFKEQSKVYRLRNNNKGQQQVLIQCVDIDVGLVQFVNEW